MGGGAYDTIAAWTEAIARVHEPL